MISPINWWISTLDSFQRFVTLYLVFYFVSFCHWSWNSLDSFRIRFFLFICVKKTIHKRINVTKHTIIRPSNFWTKYSKRDWKAHQKTHQKITQLSIKTSKTTMMIVLFVVVVEILLFQSLNSRATIIQLFYYLFTIKSGIHRLLVFFICFLIFLYFFSQLFLQLFW